MKLSIVIPHLNYGRFLKECLDSIINQTFRDYEIILVDGGSKDNTYEILKKYPQVKVIKDIPTRGFSKAVNKGIAEMKGKYFTQVNSDDHLHPKLYEYCMNEFDKNPDLGMVYTGWYWIDESGRIIGVSESQPFIFDREVLFKRNYIDSVGTVIPKRVLDDVGWLDNRITYHVDWLMAVKISDKYPVKYIERPLFYYRKHSKALVNEGFRIKDFKETLKIINKEYR